MAIDSTNELIDEAKYWDIVERSKNKGADQESQLTNLVDILSKLPPEEILQFDLRTKQLLFQAHTSKLWCAATILNQRWTSDDNFIYFKTWLISRGKEAYYNALSDPDSLVNQIDPKCEYYDFERFRYGSTYAFEKITGESIFKHPHPKNFPYTESNYPKVSFSWQTDDPQDMRKICPKLFDKVHNPPTSLKIKPNSKKWKR